LKHFAFAFALATLLAGQTKTFASADSTEPAVHLIPTPKEIELSGGSLQLGANSRIVATTKELVPLAAVLRGELLNLSGLDLPVATGLGTSGDIVLRIDASLPAGPARNWPYTIAIPDRVVITGRDYVATAMGTATLLELLEIGPKAAQAHSANAPRIRVPQLSLADHSAAEYPGMMLDVARQNNRLQDVRDCVELCRLYKVRYLHLHLNDMEAFVFPSKLFPKLGTHNGAAHGGPPCQRWDRDELLATIKYADERGIALVPELETVFHTGAMMRDMPKEFGGPGVLNMGSEKLYRSLDPLIEEMCDVFKSSPFFHIGCDEASIGGVLDAPGTKEYMQQHGLHDGQDLYRFHIDRLDKIVRRKGKRTIVWQDCPLPLDNKNIISMVWHIDNDHGDTAKMIREGYPVIQVTWTPSCASPVEQQYAWRPFDESIAPGKLAMGSNLVLWEQNGSVAIPWLRQKIPVREQRTYSPDAAIRYSRIAEDLLHTDSLLDPLLTGMAVEETGLTQSVGQWLRAGGIGNMPEYTFVKSLKISARSNIPGANIRYTVTQIPTYNAMLLRGAEPTVDSPLASGPITISPPEGEAVCVEVRLFDQAGKPLGSTWSRTYRWQPFALEVRGTIAVGDNRFGKLLTIEPREAVAGGTLHYSIGAVITADSPVLDKTLTFDKSSQVSIRYFDAHGKPRGLAWNESFRKVDFDPTNITYKRPVILWGSSSKQAAEVAVDGVVDHDQFLDIQPAPQEFAIDLQSMRNLNKVVLYTYWDGGRFYQYKIGVSTDAKRWTTVVDASKNRERATEKGYASTFSPTQARYIRVTMLRNSANPGLHIVELRAYEAK
jgi:hypothetical protein